MPTYLFVQLEVPAANTAAYIEAATELTPAFEDDDIGWTLLASWARDPAGGASVDYRNLWTLPDANSLPDTMFKLTENPTYAKLDEQVAVEVQNLGLAQPYDPGANHQPGGSHAGRAETPVYLYWWNDVTTANRAEYDILVQEMNVTLEMSFDWSLVCGWYNMTGRLNRMQNLWIVPSADAAEEALKELDTNPDYQTQRKWLDELAALVEDQGRETGSATAYDPHVTASG